MAERMPVGELDPRYSSDGVTATPWTTARRRLQTAQSYWLATVRPSARPHVTTTAAVWLDGALHFTTGRRERKAKNLARNSNCIITAGCHAFRGLDVVVEGKAIPVTGAATLRQLARAYRRKYVRHFRFEVRRGALYHQGSRILAYRLGATKALGFGKGRKFSQTRWRL